MKYEKPEVVLSAAAQSTIQGGEKNDQFLNDGQPFVPHIGTPPAYEADE
jgi:hypothetical protein